MLFRSQIRFAGSGSTTNPSGSTDPLDLPGGQLTRGVRLKFSNTATFAIQLRHPASSGQGNCCQNIFFTGLSNVGGNVCILPRSPSPPPSPASPPPPASPPRAPTLFFSQYAESNPTDDRSYLQIYNPTGRDVPLRPSAAEGYSLACCQSSCSSGPGFEFITPFALGAVIAAGATFTVCHADIADSAGCDVVMDENAAPCGSGGTTW